MSDEMNNEQPVPTVGVTPAPTPSEPQVQPRIAPDAFQPTPPVTVNVTAQDLAAAIQPATPDSPVPSAAESAPAQDVQQAATVTGGRGNVAGVQILDESPFLNDEALKQFMEQDQAPQPAPQPSTSKKEDFISPNVTQPKVVLEPWTGEAAEFPLHIFRQLDSEINSNVKSYVNSNPSVGDDGKKWMQSVRAAQRVRVTKGLYENMFTNPDSELSPFIPVAGYNVYARDVNSRLIDRNISGISAINHVMHVAGLGQDRETPLNASGFYIKLRAPEDAELSNLESLVLMEKETIGRLTGGAAITATSVYLIKHVLDLIIRNTTETNVNITNSDELLDLILVTDLQSLAVEMNNTLFPYGYPVEVPCTKDYTVCQHVEKYNLLLRYMCYPDARKLTPKQKAQMAKPDAKLTVKQVKDYQAEGPVLVSKVVTTDDGKFRIDFRTPTAREYLNDSEDWIKSIVAIVESMMNDDIDERQRAVMIEDQARLSTLCQYSHFVKSITVVSDQGESTIIDRETIMEVLKRLSAKDELLTKVAEGAREHLAAATVTGVGIPKTPCPVCEKDVVLTEEEKKHPRIIPVDAFNLFFTLTSLKLSKRQMTKLQDI